MTPKSPLLTIPALSVTPKRTWCKQVLAAGNTATVITDQLQRKITIEKTLYGTAPHYVRVNGYNGTELVTTINWGTARAEGKRYLWRVDAGGDDTWHNLSVSLPVVTGITLPNGLSYQFEYNSSIYDPNNPAKSVGWGELYRTTLPSGAVVQYGYEMDFKHDEAWV